MCLPELFSGPNRWAQEEDVYIFLKVHWYLYCKQHFVLGNVLYSYMYNLLIFNKVANLYIRKSLVF